MPRGPLAARDAAPTALDGTRSACQGRPLMRAIAAKAVAFKEALDSAFMRY